MSDGLREIVEIDGPAMLTAVLAAVLCGLLGNLLLLRRQCLLGDAISHAVLPGLVLAFLIGGARASWPMFLGAAAAGVATVLLVGTVRRFGRLESGAAMGVVFSVLFALGVVLIERAGARGVDLDPDCVLNGQLEYVFWIAPDSWGELLSPATLGRLPRELTTLLVVNAFAIACLLLFAKELKACAFDPAFASAVGLRAGAVNMLYLVVVAAAVVASFEAVGSILVIAMLVCPAATARHLTDRYGVQLTLSVVVAGLTGILGYVLAASAPSWLGTEKALSAAGMMTVVGGALLVTAVVAAPRHGIVARHLARRRLGIAVALDDALGLVWRAEEAGRPAMARAEISAALGTEPAVRIAVRRAVDRGWLRADGDRLALTPSGADRARRLVRSHRLWESYLVRELGLRADHVHRTAMTLEHVTDPTMEETLAREAPEERDPHDKRIP